MSGTLVTHYQVNWRVADSGGKFVARNGRTVEADTFFVLRPADPGKQSKVLLQIATNTYHAYTNWGVSVCTPTTAGRLTIANGTSVGDKITNRITKNVIEKLSH